MGEAGGVAKSVWVETPDPADPRVTLLHGPGVVIAVETTAVRSPLATMAAHPRVIQLDSGALAVSLEASGQSFKVLTPDAVAAASEGEWAVIVEGGRSRALAWRGEVALVRRVEDPGRAEPLQPDTRDAPRLERLRQALDRP